MGRSVLSKQNRLNNIYIKQLHENFRNSVHFILTRNVAKTYSLYSPGKTCLTVKVGGSSEVEGPVYYPDLINGRRC